MSKKNKHRGSPNISVPDLRPRIERAAHEGRYQQALELAKQLHKFEPTPAHKELLRSHVPWPRPATPQPGLPP